VRYPKYLGDLAWASGWALATRAGAAWLVVGVHAAILVLVYVPALDRRLAELHRAEWEEWAKRTRRVVPLIY
jgi:protein-S-isoprenylcysteine O-methyltransferase Ste14